jgi:hypothetical protein
MLGLLVLSSRSTVKERTKVATVRTSAAVKIWHPSRFVVQSLVGSVATNPAGMFTSCLFIRINDRLIFATYSHEMRRRHFCRAQGKIGPGLFKAPAHGVRGLGVEAARERPDRRFVPWRRVPVASSMPANGSHRRCDVGLAQYSRCKSETAAARPDGTAEQPAGADFGPHRLCRCGWRALL